MANMKVLNILHDSIVDGVGLRAVVFFSGCPHHCNNCHNPQSWDINNGCEMSVTDIVNDIQNNPLIKGVTFSGGEPFYQAKAISKLANTLKELGYNLWIYSGYTYEEIIQDEDKLNLLQYCDVLVDGKYIKEQRDLTLAFRGSKNQRIIDIQKSIETNEIKLLNL